MGDGTDALELPCDVWLVELWSSGGPSVFLAFSSKVNSCSCMSGVQALLGEVTRGATYT
jgi:hypothetical protein